MSSSYLTSLKLADVMHCETIAFPLLASGNNKFDKKLAFDIAIESINRCEYSNIQKVIIVLYGEKTTSFVKSLGYKVNTVNKTEKKKPKSDDFKKGVEKALNDAKEWMKDKDNQKMVLNLAFDIALIVLGGNGKAPQILKSIRKIFR